MNMNNVTHTAASTSIDCSNSCPCKSVPMSSSSLWTAAQLNDISTVAMKISKNPSCVRKLDKFGYSALHYAAQSNNASIVKMLLDNGADANGAGEGASPCGATPLQRAAFKGLRLMSAASARRSVSKSC